MRALAAKSERVAQQSFYLASIGYLAFGMILLLLGIIGSVTMPGLADSESIVPALAFEHLHPVAIGVFVGAVLAANRELLRQRTIGICQRCKH